MTKPRKQTVKLSIKTKVYFLFLCKFKLVFITFYIEHWHEISMIEELLNIQKINVKVNMKRVVPIIDHTSTHLLKARSRPHP